MSTKIEWARNPDGSKGETWPVVTGCTAVSEGCTNCYAARMAATRLKHHPRYAGLAVFENGKAKWTGEVRLNHDVLEQPLHWRKPRMVFVASMGDLFHESVPTPFITDIWDIMAETHRHTFQLLTKRADRLPEVFHYLAKWKNYKTPLPNVWLGVSVENQAAADERIPLLLQTPAAVRFVSVEPMLEAIVLPSYNEYIYPNGFENNGPMSTTLGYAHEPDSPIDWVICGGESGPGARPMHPDWARSLRDQCQAASVPFFFKQWGAWGRRKEAGITLDDGPFGYWDDGTPGYNEWVASGLSSHGEHMVRVGKKRAGRLLDGQVWDQFPVSMP